MSISNPRNDSSSSSDSGNYNYQEHNEGTVVRPLSFYATESARGFSAKDLVYKAYEGLRPLLEEHTSPGLMAVALNKNGKILNSRWLPSILGKTLSLSVGRHSCCDLRLPASHADISLRHAMVLFQSLPLAKTSLRVIDLHTPLGLWDEEGTNIRACEANGSIFLQIGDVYLIFLLTQDWKHTGSAHNAYRQIPERISVAENEDEEEAGVRETSTVIRRREAAMMFEQLHKSRYNTGDHLGHLQLSSPKGFECIPLTPEIADRGLLVGRYERCAFAEDHQDERLSRVHLLFIRNGDELLAIDTASTNGSYIDDRIFRTHRITRNAKFNLTPHVELSWRGF